MFKFDVKKLLIIILSLALVFCIFYIGSGMYNKKLNVKYRQAYDAGILDAGKAIFTRSSSCNPFSITLEGKTVSLINVDCLMNTENSENNNSLNLEE
jgi:hypothetical protein